jgi:hypothetical protein
MHDDAVGSSQSRGGLDECDVWYEPVNPAETRGFAHQHRQLRATTGGAWQYAQHAICPRQQEAQQPSPSAV